MAKPLPTLERINELLSYCPETGIFRWITNKARARVGDVAGSFDSRGYRRVKIDGVEYRANRLAWLLVHGYSPTGCIDHINHDLSDNRNKGSRRQKILGTFSTPDKAHQAYVQAKRIHHPTGVL